MTDELEKIDPATAVDMKEVVAGHLYRIGQKRRTWAEYRSAYKGDFWGTYKQWTFKTGDDVLPVRLQVNMLRPLINGLVGNLYYQGPDFNARLPGVFQSKLGRPEKVPHRGAEIIARFAGDWLNRSDLMAQANRCYNLALMYDPGAAFKVGYDDDESVDFSRRIWTVALPPWEVFWDERTNARERCRYMAHCRAESADWIVESFGEDAIKGLKPKPLPDVVDEGFEYSGDDKNRRDAGYLQVLEWYDLVEGKLKWGVAELHGSPETMKFEIVDEDEIPYTNADGTPAVPIVPVVLDPVPEYPLMGMSFVDGLYELNREKNLLLSYYASAARRDMARIMLYLAELGLDQMVVDSIANGKDFEFKAIPGPLPNGATLATLFHALELPPIPDTVKDMLRLLDVARQESKGTSENQEGRQNKYTSATEAQLLAQYSESATGQIALRMDEALNRTGELVLAVAHAHLGKTKLRVDLGEGETGRLDAELLEWPFILDIKDSSVAPAKEQQKKQEWANAAGLLASWVAVAAGPPLDPVTGKPAGPVPPEPVKRMAIESIEHTVGMLGLPESMRWEHLSAEAGKKKGKPELSPDMLAMAQQLAGFNGTPPAAAPSPDLGPIAPDTGALLPPGAMG